jgi:hypothetical protein
MEDKVPGAAILRPETRSVPPRRRPTSSHGTEMMTGLFRGRDSTEQAYDMLGRRGYGERGSIGYETYSFMVEVMQRGTQCWGSADTASGVKTVLRGQA